MLTIHPHRAGCHRRNKVWADLLLEQETEEAGCDWWPDHIPSCPGSRAEGVSAETKALLRRYGRAPVDGKPVTGRGGEL